MAAATELRPVLVRETLSPIHEGAPFGRGHTKCTKDTRFVLHFHRTLEPLEIPFLEHRGYSISEGIHALVELEGEIGTLCTPGGV